MVEISQIRRVLKQRPDKTKGGLAEALGIQNSGVTELLKEKGGRQLKANEIPKVVEYLELDRVQIVGEVGGGAKIDTEFVQEGGDLETVKLPFAPPGDMVGFRVRGTSMSPRYDEGDVVVVWKEQRRPVETFYGEEAAVRTAEGYRYLKKIRPGKGRLVRLESFNDEPIENVRLIWIGEIYITVRASQLRRLNARVAKRRATG